MMGLYAHLGKVFTRIVMAEKAPLHTDLADAPESGDAFWLDAADARIRAALWKGGDRGTAFIFNGRTEYIEKYGRIIRQLRERGFSVVTLDWRGQGLSDRPLKERMKGHVEDFTEYQDDVSALLDDSRITALPKPHVLFCHSMGGCIGTRTLNEGLLSPAAVVMSAPMLGLSMTRVETVASKVLIGGSKLIGGRNAFAPDPKPRTPYVQKTDFEDNTLTGDAEHFDWMRKHMERAPDLGLGPPTIGWLEEALNETRALAEAPPPSQPVLYLLGTDEEIVAPDAIRMAAARGPKSELCEIDGAKHEVFMETPAIQSEMWAAVDAFLTAQGI